MTPDIETRLKVLAWCGLKAYEYQHCEGFWTGCPDCMSRMEAIQAAFVLGKTIQKAEDAPYCTLKQMQGAVIRAKEEQREVDAKIAEMFSLKPSRSIHPDIAWNDMTDAAKTVSHTTSQQIAAAIRHKRG